MTIINRTLIRLGIKKPVIVFDLDNTIVDEMGRFLRPGIKPLLNKLKKKSILILWSSSTRERGESILRQFDISHLFERTIFREDYYEKSKFKDVGIVNGDILIDDDPAEIRYNKKNNANAYLIPPFRGKEGNEPIALLESFFKRYDLL